MSTRQPSKGKGEKFKAEQQRAREVNGFRMTAAELAKALPDADLLREIKNIGKNQFTGTRFDREAVIFEYVKRQRRLAESYSTLLEAIEEFEKLGNDTSYIFARREELLTGARKAS